MDGWRLRDGQDGSQKTKADFGGVDGQVNSLLSAFTLKRRLALVQIPRLQLCEAAPFASRAGGG